MILLGNKLDIENERLFYLIIFFFLRIKKKKKNTIVKFRVQKLYKLLKISKRFFVRFPLKVAKISPNSLGK